LLEVAFYAENDHCEELHGVDPLNLQSV
jgi:hypothetical protein